MLAVLELGFDVTAESASDIFGHVKGVRGPQEARPREVLSELAAKSAAIAREPRDEQSLCRGLRE